MEQNWITSNATGALLEALAAAFCEVVSGLAGAEVKASEHPDPPPVAEGGLIWWQEFDGWPEAALAIGAPSASWQALGAAPLVALGEASGVDEETSRSTYLEYLAQAAGSLGSRLSAEAGRQVLPVNGRETSAWPEGWREYSVFIELAGERHPLRFAVHPAFFASENPGPEPEAGAMAPADSEAAALAGRSGTFDLLLDVELGVSISFGRAMVPLREVARLTSGSIVELNRTISDPVEVIVNNCVIARGEVVVVDGNYGVRIQQIISPRERLRTLH